MSSGSRTQEVTFPHANFKAVSAISSIIVDMYLVCLIYMIFFNVEKLEAGLNLLEFFSCLHHF